MGLGVWGLVVRGVLIVEFWSVFLLGVCVAVGFRLRLVQQLGLLGRALVGGAKVVLVRRF